MKFVLASHGENLIRLEGMCLFTQDYAVVTLCQWKQKEKQTECFPKVFVYALERNAYNSKCETSDAQAIWRNYTSISKRIYRPVRGTFFKNFAKTVQNTKNRSIRIVCHTNSQSKLQFFWLLNSQKYWKISQKVRGLNNDLRCPLARRLDKTTICTRSTVSSPLFLGFPLSKLLSIP